MTSYQYVMNYLPLRSCTYCQMYQLQSVYFPKDDTSLIWQSRYSSFICDCVLSIHNYDVSSPTVYFFSCFSVVMMNFHQFTHHFGQFHNVQDSASCPDSVDSESMTLIKENLAVPVGE